MLDTATNRIRLNFWEHYDDKTDSRPAIVSGSQLVIQDNLIYKILFHSDLQKYLKYKCY